MAQSRMELVGRVRTYAMLSCTIVGVKTVRASIASLVPFIVKSAELSVAESALLLSAFFPGYAISQVPAGGITQMFGGKVVLTFSLGGTAAMIALAPALARLQNSTRWLFMCLLGMGLSQGLMGPASSSLFQAWMPREGVERVWVQKLLGLSHEVPNTIGAFLTPLLCRGGWYRCCYIYGAALVALTAFFQLCGANRPPLTPESQRGSSESESTPQVKAVEMGIFRVPAVQATIGNFFGYTWLSYTMLLLGPTYFVTKLGCDPVTAGRYIALGASVNVPGQFAMGALETALLRAGFTELSIQRWTTGVAAVLTSAFAICFGLARTPWQGFVGFLGYQTTHLLHEAGMYTNLMHLGGQDTAMLSSVSGTISQVVTVLTTIVVAMGAQAAGLVVPSLGLHLQRRTGSWLPTFVIAAAMQVPTGLMWARCCSTVPAREQLATHVGNKA